MVHGREVTGFMGCVRILECVIFLVGIFNLGVRVIHFSQLFVFVVFLENSTLVSDGRIY